jgi:hypothetical protein
VAALDDGVVGGAAFADVQQHRSDGAEDAAVEGGELLGALAAELLAPVGLEGDVVVQAVGAQPQDHEGHEGQAAGHGLLGGVGEEAHPGADAAGGPLV